MIEKSNRKRILDLILKSKNAFEFAETSEEGIIPFLNEIWDLRSMPSQDSRFQDAEGDIIQHTRNNDDWSWEELFEDRLLLLESSDKFEKFLEVFLQPKYQQSSEKVYYLVEKINDIIEPEGVVFATITYEGDFPVFELTKSELLDRPSDVPINKIPFFTQSSQYTRAGRFAESLKVDSNKPSQYFVLVADNWDDFSHKTTFKLVYFDNGKKFILGNVKIGTELDLDTFNVLPDTFFSLDESFASLGQSEDYYNQLSSLFGKKITSVLYSLKDAAFFPELTEHHEMSSFFKNSLLRNDEAERLFRIAKPMVHGLDLENLYSFDYSFCPKYGEIPVDVPFHFSTDGYLAKRMIALIGKNGAGKTQLLTTLPQDIADENSSSLKTNRPMYSKIIAVSYSTFDNFDIPKRTSDFNYVYCGLRDENGDVRTKQGQLHKFHNTWKKILKLGRMKKWKKVISNILDEALIDLFIKQYPDDEELYFDRRGFQKARESLSSGQTIVLFVVSEIVANIRLDSLLLFDEPETHLHPNAISQLMNGIAELVNEFDSYCIIATHSPIIIQEMFSRDVLVMSREENILSVKKIGVESFGENLSVITEEVFGNRSIPKFYEAVIQKLVRRFKTYDKVLEVMKEGNLPLSLNVRLYLQSLVDEDA